ncbi:secreted RxLR effector protein 161-like [Pistacia vera]|uniref:secreted RxLR effector protein 161-like n=1 Tax=Pistacia vera TaxID=55513 RepID=UPI001263C4C8|nr:secreted RxLR effector protein 161-like [Pistacia vera]
MEHVRYANAIGSVMYAMISTRLDISFAISLLSRFMSNPGTEHWYALRWVLRYINSTSHVGLEYCKMGNSLDLVGFVDSDFAGDRDTKKPITSYFFTLGGNCVSLKSQLQPIVALSSTKAEYVVVADVFRKALWLQGILSEMQLLDELVTIYSNSQSAIHLSKNPIYHERTKDMDVRFHFVKELIAQGVINLKKVAIEDNLADDGTKVVMATKLKHCLNLLFVK